jgi:hypothetical protein
VFSIVRESTCAECGAELWKGSFLRMEKERPLCMACADLDHLMFLPSGDTALTRRARKHSTLDAVVVRFSRTRGRYERQGVLVEEAALEQAERECLADADVRERTRQRNTWPSLRSTWALSFPAVRFRSGRTLPLTPAGNIRAGSAARRPPGSSIRPRSSLRSERISAIATPHMTDYSLAEATARTRVQRCATLWTRFSRAGR